MKERTREFLWILGHGVLLGFGLGYAVGLYIR